MLSRRFFTTSYGAEPCASSVIIIMAGEWGCLHTLFPFFFSICSLFLIGILKKI